MSKTLDPCFDQSVKNFNEAMGLVKEAQANWQNACKQRDDLFHVLKRIMGEMEDRYDGAPDSRTLWMGELINRARAVIVSLSPKEREQEDPERWDGQS